MLESYITQEQVCTLWSLDRAVNLLKQAERRITALNN